MVDLRRNLGSFRMSPETRETIEAITSLVIIFSLIFLAMGA